MMYMENSLKEEDFDYKESILPKDKQERLNELRRAMIDRPLTPEELRDFSQLQKEHDFEKQGGAVIGSEKEKYLELTRKQTEGGKDWTPEDAKELARLQKLKNRGIF